MSIFTKLNNYTRTIKEGVNTDNMEYRSIADYVGKVINVDGFFFNDKGKYGRQVVIVSADGYLIDMPKRAVKQFESIAEDEDLLNAVLNGELTIIDIAPISAKEGNTFSYTLK